LGLAFPQRFKPCVQGSAEIFPFGAVFPSPRAVAPPDPSRLLWRIVLRVKVQKLRKINVVAYVAGPPGRGALAPPDCETTNSGRETIESCK
jgi:hypothetical protein